MYRIFVSLLIVALSLQTVSARVMSDLPTTVVEEDLVVLTGKKLDTSVNPISVIVKTADGSSTTLNPTVLGKNKVSVQMPSVAADTKILVQISGGNIPTSAPEQFVVLVLDRPNIAGLDTQSDGYIALPSGVSGDFHASTADLVTGASQTAITTLASLSSIGTPGTSVNVKGGLVVTGTIVGTASNAISAGTANLATNFSGGLSGDVTGTQGATSISSATVTGKSLTGFSAAAGTVSASDTVLSGFNKLVANLAVTDTTVAGHTTTLAGHTSSLASHSSDITANTSAITAQATTLANHATDITANSSAIATHTTDIAANTASIATSATNIAANSTAIVTHTTDIAANTTAIVTHTADIAANTASIATQATTIATHTTDIAANTTAIATQATTIATHTTDIAANTTAIAGKQDADSDLTAFAAKTAPDGAVVGTTDSQNLTNKILQDSTVSFADNSDISKVLKFELSGISSATTQTITMPNASGTVTLLGNTATGTGNVVLANSPALVTPSLGVATATSVNKVLITQPATTATLALANNSSLNTVGAFGVTLNATNTTSITLPVSGTLATTGDLAAKADYDPGLASLAALNGGADKMIYTTATDTYATTGVTALARTNLAMGSALDIETTGTYDATGIGFVTFIDNSSTTDDVTTISGGVAGQKLTIVVSTTSANSVKFVDGSNLKLGGTYTAGVTDTLVLVCDGTNWYELSRGNN